MRICRIAFGNEKESFIEDRLVDGFNVIYSDDNNKGKTIVIQSALYAMGNEPIFPSSFDYENYYHYVEIALDNNKNYNICRKGETFVVKNKENIIILESISEFKRYFSKNGLVFPIIIKDGNEKMVDPLLLYQIFFVGQDKKNTSTLFNDSYYKKDDFWSLIYTLKGLKPTFDTNEDYNEIKERILLLEDEEKVLKQKSSIKKNTSAAANIVFKKNNNDAINGKIKNVEEIKNRIVNLSNERNRIISRKILNEKTLSEIRSLNRTIKTGTLQCSNCGSTNILYSSEDESVSFDISNIQMRNNIIDSIKEKINTYEEEIESLTIKINELQDNLQNKLIDEDVSLESMIIYKDELINNIEFDRRLVEIEKEIKSLKEKIKNRNSVDRSEKEAKNNLKKEIIDEMNNFYKKIDQNGNLYFDDIFSKRNVVYSGCEGTEFYLSRLFALAKSLNHKFPIIMDYFRDGELSSEKEDILLYEFGKLENQIIFTATLKKEETGKYKNYLNINAIDYSTNKTSHILSSDYSKKFKDILTELLIEFKN